MTTYFFSVPWLIATSLVIGCILGQLGLRQVPQGWKRFFAWIGLYLCTFNLSLVLYSHGAVGQFRRSIRQLMQMSQSEVCSPPTLRSVALRNFRVFEEWAKQVRKIQAKSNLVQTTHSFSNVSGEDCELKLPDEPWLHYRWRRLERSLSPKKVELDSQTENWLRRLILILKIKALDWREAGWEIRNRFFVGPLELNAIWTDYSDGVSYSLKTRVPFLLETLGEENKLENEVGKSMSLEVRRSIKNLFLRQTEGAVTIRQQEIPKFIHVKGPVLCERLVTQPDTTPQTQALFQYFRSKIQTCQLKERWVPHSCNWDALSRSANIACILRNEESNQLKYDGLKVKWEGIPDQLNLWVHILKIPDNYLSESDLLLKPYRQLRLTYEIARTVNPRFVFQPSRDEISADRDETEKSIKLVDAEGMVLTRLGGEALFSPFLESEVPPQIQRKMKWFDVEGQMQKLIRQFRKSYSFQRDGTSP